MSKEIKVRKLPKDANIDRSDLGYYNGSSYKQDVYEEIVQNRDNLDWAKEDAGFPYWDTTSLVRAKLRMIARVKEYLRTEGLDLDEFNGLGPTRLNYYKGYGFATLWLWNELVNFIKYPDGGIKESWYKKYKGVLASVMKKYPKITGVLISGVDLHNPNNRLLECSKMENADFDNDHTDEAVADENADKFKDWILHWCNQATEKDKMRVRRWFETKKSHRQIFAEINKVVGNYHKFNARLALFVERLFNQQGLDYFFEKTGFATKEDLFMAYFDKLTDFDEETKKSFIKKYLLNGDK